MFETAVFANENSTKRVWSTCAGMTAQTLLVLGAFLAPVIWPEVLPHAQMLVSLVAPSAPERQEPAAQPRQTPRVVNARPFQIHGNVLQLPTVTPAHPVRIDDPADLPAPCVGCIVGIGNTPNSLVTQILDIGRPVLIRPPERFVPAPQAPPAPPIRLQGGNVRLAQPIYRVEPRYPKLAIAARISGPVELEGIIGTDGRIRELHVLKGNPMLAPAALDAVSQWIYAPTLLNGKPVEVIAPITVIFRLTQ
jgi:protein TonB